MLPGYSRCTCQDGCLDPAGIPSEGSIREDGKRCLVQLRRDAAKLYLQAAGYHSNSQAKLLAKRMQSWTEDASSAAGICKDWVFCVSFQCLLLKPSGKRPCCWERLKAKEGKSRWCSLPISKDGQRASPTQWMWIWANSERYWGTGEPGTPQAMGSQRVGHDLATEQQWQPGEPGTGYGWGLCMGKETEMIQTETQ